LNKEICLEPNSLEEMMNLLFYMKKSKFFKRNFQWEKLSINRDLKTFVFWNSKLEIIRVNLESSSLKLPKFQIWERRFTICKTWLLKRDFKLRLCLKNLRTHWTSTDGGNLKELIQINGKCLTRFKLFKEDLSRKLKKLSRKMSSFKRKRNYTLSWRIFLQDNQDQKLQNNCLSISKT
jgi:hypothetical protein